MAESFENRLINFLIEISAMSQKANRDALLTRLPPYPVSSISRDESILTDLTNIVKAVNKWVLLDSGELALKVLMDNAQIYVKGLKSEAKLNELIKELGSEFNLEKDEIEIPFVIVAMTQAEANELQHMTFNQQEPLNDEFKNLQELTQIIKEHGIVNFINHYSEIREEWKPYIFQDYTIQSVILDMIEEINYYYNEVANFPLIKPIFLSHDCFGLDDSKRIITWNELRQLGCVLIVDSISLFHPTVRQKLLKAEISSNKNVAILVLSPINPSVIQANQLLEETIKYQWEPAFFRFHEDLDKLCEIGIGDLRAIKRLLFSILPETAQIIVKQKPQLKNRQGFRRKMGTGNRIDRLWTGSSK
jgi:Effector-associated domain 8